MVRYCGTSMLEMNKPRTLGLLCASMFLCACVDHTKQTEARMKSESTQKITGSPRPIKSGYKISEQSLKNFFLMKAPGRITKRLQASSV